jgi:hypothetical protein
MVRTSIPGMASPSNHVAFDLFASSLPKLDPLASPNLLGGPNHRIGLDLDQHLRRSVAERLGSPLDHVPLDFDYVPENNIVLDQWERRWPIFRDP